MPSGKDIRKKAMAIRVPANEPNPTPPPPQNAQRQPLRPVQPVVFDEESEVEVEKKPWWAYALAFLSPFLILALFAIPIVLVMVSAWGHTMTLILFALVSIITAREKIDGHSRFCEKKIITRWWAVKLIFVVWWLCTLIISLT